MSTVFKKLMRSLSSTMHKLIDGETPDQRQLRESLALQHSVAALLYETARVDHRVTDADLGIASESLRELFSISDKQARELLAHVAQLHLRPTSYHPLVKSINDKFTAEQKHRLIELMWRVAHADREIDMHEDHLVRKIAELLYVPHSEFITAKHRARKHSA